MDLQQSIALTTRTVKNAYWDYVYSINSLQVARQSLDLAQESLRNTRSRVEIGTLAPIDVVQAESEVASREEAVILAEAAIGQSEDQLRSIIFDPKTPDFWTMSLQPTDTAPFQLQAVDVPAAVSRALAERTDLITARKRLEITDYNVKYFKNQTLPNLDVRFDYNSTGLGGTQLIRDPGLTGVPAAGHRRGAAHVRRPARRRLQQRLSDLCGVAECHLSDRARATPTHRWRGRRSKARRVTSCYGSSSCR